MKSISLDDTAFAFKWNKTQLVRGRKNVIQFLFDAANERARASGISDVWRMTNDEYFLSLLKLAYRHFAHSFMCVHKPPHSTRISIGHFFSQINRNPKSFSGLSLLSRYSLRSIKFSDSSASAIILVQHRLSLNRNWISHYSATPVTQFRMARVRIEGSFISPVEYICVLFRSSR